MNLCQRKYKVDKRKKISEQHRKSFIENTRTSRYRSFAEREMRNGGVSGLIVRIKGILQRTLNKTRYGLFDCGDLIEETYLANGTKEPLYDDPRFHKLLELLQDFSPSYGLLENFLKERKTVVNRICGLVSHQWGKICQDMRLPSVADKYIFISKIPIDVIHECMRFRLDYKPKVQLSKHSIRQVISLRGLRQILLLTLHERMKFSINDFFCPNPQETADSVTLTKEILNGKLHFLCSEI